MLRLSNMEVEVHPVQSKSYKSMQPLPCDVFGFVSGFRRSNFFSPKRPVVPSRTWRVVQLDGIPVGPRCAPMDAPSRRTGLDPQRQTADSRRRLFGSEGVRMFGHRLGRFESFNENLIGWEWVETSGWFFWSKSEDL